MGRREVRLQVQIWAHDQVARPELHAAHPEMSGGTSEEDRRRIPYAEVRHGRRSQRMLRTERQEVVVARGAREGVQGARDLFRLIPLRTAEEEGWRRSSKSYQAYVIIADGLPFAASCLPHPETEEVIPITK